MRIPSSLDVQDDELYTDKYYGRVPKMLHAIEEADIGECNPEYVELVDGFMDSTIPSQNISTELLNEIEALINIMGDEPGTRSWEDNKVIACVEA